MGRLTMRRNTDGTVSQPTDMDWYSVLDKLTTYEDAEEQGRLVPVVVLWWTNWAERRTHEDNT